MTLTPSDHWRHIKASVLGYMIENPGATRMDISRDLEIPASVEKAARLYLMRDGYLSPRNWTPTHDGLAIYRAANPQ